MNAGAPHGTGVTHARQETEIRDMLARGVTHQTIAAALGCTVARVARVATGGIPTPRQPAQAAPLPIPDLLAAGHAHDDPGINRLTHRIVGDLKLLRQAIDVHAARADAAHGQHPARRRTDTPQAAS